MQNINATVKGSILTLTVDLSKDLGQSKSGKTTLIGTSGGNQAIQGPDGMVYIGVNVYKK